MTVIFEDHARSYCIDSDSKGRYYAKNTYSIDSLTHHRTEADRIKNEKYVQKYGIYLFRDRKKYEYRKSKQIALK